MGTIKVEKWQNRIFENSWFGDLREKVSKLAQNQTLWYFSKKRLTIFLVFGLKLVLNMTFNLNEIYFSEKFEIWRYLTSTSKNWPNWGFDRFLEFPSLVYLDFAHDHRWAWFLVVFIQFAGIQFYVFFFILKIYNVGTKILERLEGWKNNS